MLWNGGVVYSNGSGSPFNRADAVQRRVCPSPSYLKRIRDAHGTKASRIAPISNDVYPTVAAPPRPSTMNVCEAMAMGSKLIHEFVAASYFDQRFASCRIPNA